MLHQGLSLRLPNFLYGYRPASAARAVLLRGLCGIGGFFALQRCWTEVWVILIIVDWPDAVWVAVTVFADPEGPCATGTSTRTSTRGVEAFLKKTAIAYT